MDMDIANLSMLTPVQPRKIVLGICAMDKKAQSKPMREIIARLPQSLFEVVIFGDQAILGEPVETWPVVEALIAFYSNGYPLAKALEYVELRKPYLINDLRTQIDLQDRRKVYAILERIGIDVPRHVVLERGGSESVQLEEHDEYIVVNGVHINKPFVEKPVNADDHNIYIYYPMSAGGGSKRLFRKVNDRSSEFYPRVNDVRKHGSYIYEEFLNTQGTDVKVYTVGTDYGHAEARKSPVVDGRVHRDDAGLEVRYPVILKPKEKLISRDITLAFKQTVCGFDLLRVQGKSYVCDVNGWSFVKKNRKYYDDCSRILCETMLQALRPEFHSTLSTTQPLVLKTKSKADLTSALPAPVARRPSFGNGNNSPTTPSRDASPSVKDADDDKELLCVISVIRHGDRTPKQKMKLRVWDPRYLDYYHEHSPSAKKNLKLKSRAHLLEFLDVTKNILAEGKSKWYGNNEEMFVKLQRVRDVLEQHEITGVNRKMQMKPERWAEMVEVGPDGEQRTAMRASHILVILKWGGVLTRMGEKQAEALGATFRSQMYPDPSGGGVLRLHSTFRHDLKIKASDEGRVMKTAAAFTKGLLELEGDLTPVLVSLVTVQENNPMLDHCDNNEIKTEMDKCKSYINTVLQQDETFTEDFLTEVAPAGNSFMRGALLKLGNPKQTLATMHVLIKRLCEELNALCARVERGDFPPRLYDGESYYLMLYRWETLDRDFVKGGQYDLSKVPELHDMCRYDVLHNYHVGVGYLDELFRMSDIFADCVVPQEYGISIPDKRIIGAKMCHVLVQKIMNDLKVAISGGTQNDMAFELDDSHGDDLRIRTLGRRVRTRLYFTSESHLYTLLNVLMYLPGDETSVISRRGLRVLDKTSELAYLTQISIRLFDIQSKVVGDPDRFKCEISFSPGAATDPCVDKTASVVPSVTLTKSINCSDLLRCFAAAAMV